MAKLKLTIACGDYDIVRPLKEGLVEAAGIELIFLTDMGPRERHWRLARKHEFDICEENVGAYFIAREQGHALTAIPVFMHRRFRHGFVFINTNCRHQGTEGPDRQEDRRHQFHAGRQHLDARNSGGILRPAAPLRDLGHRAQRGHPVRRAEGPQHRDGHLEAAQRHAGRRRHPGDDLALDPDAVRQGRQAGGADCSPTTSRSRSTSSSRPASSRSCT